MNKKEILRKISVASEKLEAIQKACNDEVRVKTSEEREQWDALVAERKALNAELKDLEVSESIESEKKCC